MVEGGNGWMEHAGITEKVIHCAYTVYNTMGFGFLESVYERCMLIELARAGLQAESQCPIKVYYDENLVGDYYADILVEGCVIVELKSVRHLAPAHEVQLVNYLAATSKNVGLLINFAEQKVEVKRKVRELPCSADF